MKPHKWHKEIKAWADGAKIQFKDSKASNQWLDCIDNDPAWEVLDFLEYRIKPQPKEPQYLDVYGWLESGKVSFSARPEWPYIGKIKLETDDGA